MPQQLYMTANTTCQDLGFLWRLTGATVGDIWTRAAQLMCWAVTGRTRHFQGWLQAVTCAARLWEIINQLNRYVIGTSYLYCEPLAVWIFQQIALSNSPTTGLIQTL